MLQLSWRDGEPRRSSCGVRSLIEHRNDEILLADRQCAGQVNAIRAAQGVLSRHLPGQTLNGGSQLLGTRRRPELLPGRASRHQIRVVEIVVASGGCQGGADLGIRQPARDGGITTGPQRGAVAAARAWR